MIELPLNESLDVPYNLRAISHKIIKNMKYNIHSQMIFVIKFYSDYSIVLLLLCNVLVYCR